MSGSEHTTSPLPLAAAGSRSPDDVGSPSVLRRIGHDQRPVRRGGEAGLGRVGEFDLRSAKRRERCRAAPAWRDVDQVCIDRRLSTSKTSSKSIERGAELARRGSGRTCRAAARSTISFTSSGIRASRLGRRLVDDPERSSTARRRSSSAQFCSCCSSNLALETITSSPVSARMRVLLRPIFSTVPVVVPKRDRVAAAERLVEDDRERREQVARRCPGRRGRWRCRRCRGRRQAGDVDPEIVEDEDDRDREQGDADQQADDADRRAERAVLVVGRRRGARRCRGSARAPRSRPGRRRR